MKHKLMHIDFPPKIRNQSIIPDSDMEEEMGFGRKKHGGKK